MRARSGHNDNPTVMQFRRNLQYAIMITLLIPPVGTNCEPDNARMLITDFKHNIDESKVIAANNVINEKIENWFLNNEEVNLDIIDEKQSYENEVEQVTDLQHCAKNHVAGYLAYKCLNKFQCSNCEKELVDNDRDLNSQIDLILLWKAYPPLKGKACGGLKAPTTAFYLIILTCYVIF